MEEHEQEILVSVSAHHYLALPAAPGGAANPRVASAALLALGSDPGAPVASAVRASRIPLTIRNVHGSGYSLDPGHSA